MPIFPHKESALPGALAGLFVRGRFGGVELAAAFCCRILRAAAQEGRKGFFSAENLCAGFCGKLARRILREARGLLFFARLMGRGVLRELFLRFRLKRAAIFSGAWLPCGGVVFFASHCLLRGSLLDGCAQCALRSVKICARTFFSRDFFAPCGSGAMNLGGILILWLAGAPAVFLRRLLVAISMVRAEDFGIILQTFLRAFFSRPYCILRYFALTVQ